MTRAKLPSKRHGTTRKFAVDMVRLYVTINRDHRGRICEMFAKATHGHQPHMDGICLFASLAMQHGAEPQDIAAKLRHTRHEPAGIVGQPKSLTDALGVALEAEITATENH